MRNIKAKPYSFDETMIIIEMSILKSILSKTNNIESYDILSEAWKIIKAINYILLMRR